MFGTAMFGSAQLKLQVATLQERNRALEGLVEELAQRAGIEATELRRLRDEVGPQVPEESRRLVAEDQVIAAIKAYRRHTGAGLKEAKDAIDRYRSGL